MMHSAREASTAVHEAGHTVTSVILRRRFDHVSIEPEEDSLGRVIYRMRRSDADPPMEPAMNRMTIALAGTEAEKRAGRRPQHYSWDEDRRTAQWLAHDLAGGDEELTSLYFRAARRRAALLVDGRWEAIERVAAALVERRRLGYSEVMALVYPGWRPA